MSIARFQGRGTAGAVRTQNRNAPTYLTQYSGRGPAGQDGQLYPVGVPGATQTASREPNPPIPKLPAKDIIKNNVVIIRYFITGNNEYSFYISPWNVSYVIDDLPAGNSLLVSQDYIYGQNPANGKFTWILFNYNTNLEHTGFVALEISRSGVVRTNSYNSFTAPGYQWVQDMYVAPQLPPNSLGSPFLIKNQSALKYGSGRDFAITSDPPISYAASTTTATKIKFTLDLSKNISKNRLRLNTDFPIHEAQFIPRINDYIDANDGQKVFTSILIDPPYTVPLSNPNLPVSVIVLWGFSL